MFSEVLMSQRMFFLWSLTASHYNHTEYFLPEVDQIPYPVSTIPYSLIDILCVTLPVVFVNIIYRNIKCILDLDIMTLTKVKTVNHI